MKAKKIINPDTANQVTSSTTDAVKNIGDLNKVELVRKKRVDPEVE